MRPGAITSEEHATRASLWLFDIETDTEVEVLAGLDYELNAVGPQNIFYFGHYEWSALYDWWQP